MSYNEATCRICSSSTIEIGCKKGRYSGEVYKLRHCPQCRFSFVANPWLEFEKIYSRDYYHGTGADPLVDYVFELEHPGESIRHYEWSGILKVVRSLARIDRGTRWLDFGCGNGGLVRHVRQQTGCDIVGFEEGWIREYAVEHGVPILTRSELTCSTGSFDVITAIEVVEHVVNPIGVLREIRSLLRPSGLFFYTTGNARPFRGRLANWGYVVPEIHVAYFEPETLALALRMTGFEPEFMGFLPGFDDVIRFKLLKNLGVRRRSAVEAKLPWPVITRLVDRRLAVTKHPIGRARIPASLIDV
jgi:SAM-dependent methyltransferase